MLSGTQIAERMSAKRSNTDLGLLYEIWASDQDTMRSSDQIAIRKAVAALDRVACTMTRNAERNTDAAHRILPEITPTTRVRKTPERFWLEIDVDASSGSFADHAIVFVEFSKTQVRFGVRLPATSATSDFDELSQLGLSGASDDADISTWQIEQSRPPAERAACSSDLNAWLSGRAAAKQKDDSFLTLSKSCSGNRPLFEELTMGLDYAAALCEQINGQAMFWQRASDQEHRPPLLA